MLNSVLMVGVPMMALLAAAFYIFTKTQADSTQQGGFRRESWASAQSTNRPSSANVRRRSRQDRNDNQSPSSSSPDARYVEEEHCEICFEDKNKVQLHPCGHSDICETCVSKLLLSNRRECPFCRSRIAGYIDLANGDMFG